MRGSLRKTWKTPAPRVPPPHQISDKKFREIKQRVEGEIRTRKPCKDEDRGGRDAATSQGTVSHQECEEVRKVLPQTFRGMWLCNPIDFRLLASRTVPK